MMWETWVLIHLATVFVSAFAQTLAMTDRHKTSDYGMAAILAMLPIINVMIAGIAAGGLIKRKMK